MNRNIFLAGIGVAAMVIFAALVVGLTRRDSPRGSVINPALPASEIALTDQTGQPFRLSSLKGKVTLVYFGFTNCPDECPLTMAKLKQVIASLGDQSSNARVIMITTDPVRDTSSQLAGYLANFDESFIGLTGSPAALQKVWSEYGVTVLEGGETHSNLVYMIDMQGNLRETLPYEMQAADITADVRLLLKGE
jgi:protein SCO1/2